MTKGRRYNKQSGYGWLLRAWMLAAVVVWAGACTQESEEATPEGLCFRFTDSITESRAEDHINKDAVNFRAETDIQICIDYYHAVDEGNKQKYVCGAKFTKHVPRGPFTSPYSIVWLDDYLFDVYGTYPADVKTSHITLPEEPDIVYHNIDINYTKEPQYYLDDLGTPQWHAVSGATLHDADGNPTSDPHDLITSMVLTPETAPLKRYITFGTRYSDHGEDPVYLQFKHRLSRLEPYFVNGMGDTEEVYLKEIAIFPTVKSASFALKRHRWINKVTQDKFKFSSETGGWYYRNGTEWEEEMIDNARWADFIDEADLRYQFTTPYRLTSSSAVMAEDEVEVNGETVRPVVDFRMLPESGIDCMILHFLIGEEKTDAYVPVKFENEMNVGGDLLTQMGHTTRLVLTYRATMITLLYVQYIDDWNPLPGRFVVGDLKID